MTVNVRRQAVNGAAGHGDVGQARILHFFTQHACTHCAGTHTGVTGNDDLRTWLRSLRDITSRQRGRAFGFGFHVACRRRVAASISSSFTLLVFSRIEDHEGDRHCRTDGRDVREVRPFGVIASTAVIEPERLETPDRRPARSG